MARRAEGRGYCDLVRWLPAIGVALLASVTFAACGSSDEGSSPPQQPATIETGTPTNDREQAPAITGESLDGDAIALGDFRGRPVLINVWSSW
jgi:hypothetical protein